jgi:predicted ATPase/DNA-binding SARP family transcriptional activator
MEFRILGPLEVEVEGRPVEVGSPSQRLLLALLLANAGRMVSLDRLAEDMWEENPPPTARHTLQGYVYRLRRGLGSEGWRLETRHPGYSLKVTAEETDAGRFEQLWRRGRSLSAEGRFAEAAGVLTEALSLFRGEVLADVPEVAALTPERTRLTEMRLAAIEDRLEAELAAGGAAKVAAELEALVEEYPYREKMWGQLMVALYRCGRQADALRAYRRVWEVLGADLGIEPSPWLSALEEQILIQGESIAEGVVALTVPSNLPRPRTAYLGREREVADLIGMLGLHRLVTVVGAPGCGKTRLAVETADRVREMFPHGVFFVSLADLNEEPLVASAIDTSVGVWAPDRPSEEAVVDHLRTRRVLLVLDNFEHILAAAPLVGRLLDAAPRLAVLVTSRSPLRITGEREYPLGPLPVPSASEVEASTDLSEFPALMLFADRAAAVRPGFRLTTDIAPLVRDVAGLVDGVPLALELAASSLKTMPLAELCARLGEGSELLARGTVDGPARHRTVSEAIGWSYDLLDPPAQRLFRCLGVFRGTFDLESVTAVSGRSAPEVTDPLFALVEASLVNGPPVEGPPRYGLLETVRHFARHRLELSGELERAAARHVAHYAALVEEAEGRLTQVGQAAWLDQLEWERPNLFAALRWAGERGDFDVALTMAGRLWRFWQLRGPLAEGRTWLEDLLARAEAASPAARAKALIGLGGVCYWQGDLDAAEDAYRRAIVADLDPDDWWQEYEALLGLVITIACHRGSAEEALPLEERYQSLLAQHPDDMAAAGFGMATSALVRMFLGDLEGSRRLSEQLLEITRTIGERWYEGQTLGALGVASLLQKDFPRAKAELAEALEVSVELNDQLGTAIGLERLGQAEAALGNPRWAVLLAAAASRLREEFGLGMTIEAYRWDVEDAMTAARRVMEPDDLTRAWAEGRSMAVEDLIRLPAQPPVTA